MTKIHKFKNNNLLLFSVIELPIFFIIVYLIFKSIISFHNIFIKVFNYIYKYCLLDSFINSQKLELLNIIINSINCSIFTVLPLIPIITSFYLFLSLLENSGYLDRIAYFLDKIMQLIGLPGKSFFILLTGLGCTVPALLGCQMLKHKREQYLMSMMLPYISCSARLAIYIFLSVTFVPNYAGFVVAGIYLIGIVISILTGFFFKNSLLREKIKNKNTSLPKYQLPSIKIVILTTFNKTKDFFIDIIKVFIPIILVFNLLLSISFKSMESHNNSILSVIGKSAVKIFHPIGLKEENWQASIAIIAGFLAKETIIGTLRSFQLNNIDKEKKHTTNFNTPFQFSDLVTVISFLIFVSLYTPCINAIITIYRMFNIKWALFVACWSINTAYSASTLFYQIMTYNKHPTSSLLWIISILAIFTCFFFIFKQLYNNRINQMQDPRETLFCHQKQCKCFKYK